MSTWRIFKHSGLKLYVNEYLQNIKTLRLAITCKRVHEERSGLQLYVNEYLEDIQISDLQLNLIEYLEIFKHSGLQLCVNEYLENIQTLRLAVI